jgi:hypothetical protein
MIPYDKALHIIYGAVTFVVAYLFTTVWLGLAAVVAIALAKEVHDAFVNWKATGNIHEGPHGVEFMDALATIAGGILAALPLFKPSLFS